MTAASTQYPHLSKAPIVEAAMDFRVKLPADFKLDAFQTMRSHLATEYPGFEEQQIVQQMIRPQPGSAAEVSTRFSGTHGYRLISGDGKNVVQLRRDGFTFSRLTPYTKWEEVFAEAWRLWVLYVEASEPLEVSRIAVRYINRMLFPLPFSNPEEYLKAPPMPAKGGPPGMMPFFLRELFGEAESNVS